MEAQISPALAALLYFSGLALYVLHSRTNTIRRRKEVRKVNPIPTAAQLQDGEVVLVADTRCLIGEGVIWDDRRNVLHWIDIQGKKFFELTMDGTLTTFHLDERPGAFALRDDKPGFLFAFESGFAIFDPSTGDLQRIASPYQQTPGVRLNDGRCDRQGRFVCGGFNATGEGTSEWQALCGTYRVLVLLTSCH
jgi:sugar lactone lactonase YvrE